MSHNEYWVDFNVVEQITQEHSCELSPHEYEMFLEMSDRDQKVFLLDKQEDWYQVDGWPSNYEIVDLEDLEPKTEEVEDE